MYLHIAKENMKENDLHSTILLDIEKKVKIKCDHFCISNNISFTLSVYEICEECYELTCNFHIVFYLYYVIKQTHF